MFQEGHWTEADKKYVPVFMSVCLSVCVFMCVMSPPLPAHLQ